jgi:hypothetical protein
MNDLNTLVDSGQIDKQQRFYRDATSVLRVHSDLESANSLIRVAKTAIEREFASSLRQALENLR